MLHAFIIISEELVFCFQGCISPDRAQDGIFQVLIFIRQFADIPCLNRKVMVRLL